MSWSTERHAGFTSADQPFRPNVTNWRTHNVATLERDPGSLLHWYRQLIALRNAEPALSVGRFTPLSQRDAPIFAFLREHEGSRLLVLINLAYRDATLALPEGFRPDAWSVAFPQGAALPFVAPRPGRKPSGTEPAQVRLAAQQVVVLKAR